MEYLIFKTLAFAVTASIIIWYSMKRRKKDLKENEANPKELEDGRYAIKKPENKHLTGVEYDSIETDPKFKENETAARLPDPKGKPTIRP